MTSILQEQLQKFEMQSSFINNEEGNLFFVEDKESIENPYIFLALEKAEFFDVKAVYFRYFEDEKRPPIPQIYIYDWSNDLNFSHKKINELRKKVWNAGVVPIIFLITAKDIKIFNAINVSKFDINGDILDRPLAEVTFTDTLELLKLYNEFSAKRFDNGSFWETSNYLGSFDLSKSAYEKLLLALKDVLKNIVKNNILPEKIAKKLLVISILVKYLEERVDKNGNTVFKVDFFALFTPNATEFIDVLKNADDFLGLLDYLNQHFKGDIFKLNEDEKNIILKSNLEDFVKFLEGKTQGIQYSIWRLYSFKYLPIELISNIYEQFLGKKEGVVYTPPYLVNFLVDECMPLSLNPFLITDKFKVLDPACGSGIFLVAVYRRLIDWWRLKNNWKKDIGLQQLLHLLKNNIYGIDKDEEAVELALFSLTLALLDNLDPKVIWEELKFPILKEENLFQRDFFEIVYQNFYAPEATPVFKQAYKPIIEADFDLIIGNPPFGNFTKANLKSEKAEKIDDYFIAKKERNGIPDKNIVLLFAEQSMFFAKANAKLCLILQSSAFLYNNNSLKFRKYFLKKYNVSQIIDFTHIARVLFDQRGDIGTLALFAENKTPDDDDILHLIVKRTKPIKEKIYFEVDKYDFHYVSKKDARQEQLIWKCNYLGGGRVFDLVKRLTNYPTLKDYLDKKEKDGWIYSEGFIIGDKKEIKILEDYSKKNDSLLEGEKKEYEILSKKYKKVEHLKNKPFIPTRYFTEKGVNEKKIVELQQEYFISPKNEKLFSPPHILIKELIGNKSIPIELRNDFLSFKHRIVGIYAPENQINQLNSIEYRIKNNQIYLFFLTAFSSEYLVNKATSILKSDIDNLPFPENEEDLGLFDLEQIIVNDTVKYFRDFRSQGEKSLLAKKVQQPDLKDFGKLYCEILNTVYDDFRSLEPFITDNHIYYVFYYGDKPDRSFDNILELETELDKLIFHNVGRHLSITRVIRIYDKNMIYLVKPNQLRYWLQSVAIKDADETFADLVEQEYVQTDN